jgi:hypothetical protein
MYLLTAIRCGMLSNQWIVSDFYPIRSLLRDVRSSAYSSEAANLPAAAV